MAVTLEQFLAKYPRFNIKSVGEIQAYLDVAARTYVRSSVFGIHTDHAIGLVAAHFLEIDWIQSGETISVGVQAASGQGARGNANQDDWQLTTWGRQYKYLFDGLMNNTLSPFPEIDPNPEIGIGFTF